MAFSLFPKHADWVVTANHRNRTLGLALGFVVLGAHMHSQGGYGPLAWSLLTLQFLLYPHLLYLRTRAAAKPRRAEMNNLLLDSLLFGVWFAALGFPLWATFAMCLSTTINNANYRGARGAVLSLLALALGALASVLLLGFRFSPEMEMPTTIVCSVGLTLYLVLVSTMAFARNQSLHDTRTQLRHGEQALQKANETLQQQLQEIGLLQTQLSEQAMRDPLTGLYNRRYLDDTLARELTRCKREGLPLCVMMIDIDHFKQVNDTYGHPAGDAVLKTLAGMLATHARSADMACRYGGEEFLMLLPHMSLRAALQRAEEWRRDFAAATVVFGNFQIQTTVSIGIAAYPGDSTSPETLITNADGALYRAKHSGRNCVVACSPPESSSISLLDPLHAID